MLGPIIRAAVGQVVTVVLKNNLSFPCNLEPSGVQPEKPGADGAAALSPEAAPGATVTYRWLVPDSMGPGPMEPSAKLWLYRWVAVGGCGCRRGTAGIRQLDGHGVQRHTLQACRLVWRTGWQSPPCTAVSCCSRCTGLSAVSSWSCFRSAAAPRLASDVCQLSCLLSLPCAGPQSI
jgi:hypothetical protein